MGPRTQALTLACGNVALLPGSAIIYAGAASWVFSVKGRALTSADLNCGAGGAIAQKVVQASSVPTDSFYC